jgi:hypothetical protein
MLLCFGASRDLEEENTNQNIVATNGKMKNKNCQKGEMV